MSKGDPRANYGDPRVLDLPDAPAREAPPKATPDAWGVLRRALLDAVAAIDEARRDGRIGPPR